MPIWRLSGVVLSLLVPTDHPLLVTKAATMLATINGVVLSLLVHADHPLLASVAAGISGTINGQHTMSTTIANNNLPGI